MEGGTHQETEYLINSTGAEEEEVEEYSACCNPSHSLHRFMALLFMCLLGFGKFIVDQGLP